MKQIFVYAVCLKDIPRPWSVRSTMKQCRMDYCGATNMHWRELKANGFTVRKFQLKPTN
jgi:hypothetical protein